MMTWRIRSSRSIIVGSVFLPLLALAACAFPQTEQLPPNNSVPLSQRQSAGVYTIGPEDILDIKVEDSPEISGKYRIAETGDLSLPQLSTPIRASGTTTLELSKNIAQALKTADILRDPIVSVFIQEYHSQTVMVLGAVAKPGVYPLEKRTTLLELLSMSGGPMPTAGGTLTIARKSVSLAEETIRIDFVNLVSQKDPSLNLDVQSGDVINVATMPIIYVVGAVVKPGGFPLQNSVPGLTVLQALALAEGFGPAASPGRAIIVRRSASGTERQEIPVNLAKMMDHKLGDQVLEGNDILFVPSSSFKKGARKLGDAALQAASTAAGYYGFGLRP